MSTESSSVNFSSIYFIDQLRAQNREAVSKLVKAYTLQLFRASLGMGFNETEAQELVQATWSTFFEKVPQFQGRSHIRTYLFGFLYNKAKEARRQQGRYDLNDPIEDVMDRRFKEDGHWKESPKQPDQVLLDTEFLGMIQKCLDRVPLAQKSAFVLRELEGQTTEEICKTLDVSVTNLGVMLYRAKNRLRECIEKLIQKEH